MSHVVVVGGLAVVGFEGSDDVVGRSSVVVRGTERFGLL